MCVTYNPHPEHLPVTLGPVYHGEAPSNEENVEDDDDNADDDVSNSIAESSLNGDQDRDEDSQDEDCPHGNVADDDARVASEASP